MTCDFCKEEIEGGYYCLPDDTAACVRCYDNYLKKTVDATSAVILHRLRFAKRMKGVT